MEGPSIHLLAQELKVLINQKVKEAFGNSSFEKEPLINQKINDVYAFGKKLVIQLQDYALVTHFLMYGSYRLDSSRENMAPRLALITPKHSLFIYNCSVKCLETKNFKNSIDLEFDVLSPDWNIKKVINAIKKNPEETIDDVLLDQEIFAGVGNIIKNEVLFLSKISPLNKIKQLSAKKIKEIALNARQFSHKFLELRKIFQLKKNLMIYRKKECPICSSPIIRKKTGNKKRWSFFCPKCQL